MQAKSNDSSRVSQKQETHHYWFPQDQLGILEGQILTMCYMIGQTKKANRSVFKNLERTLKLLKLVQSSDEILHMGLCCNLNGERGLLVSCMGTTKVLAPLPVPGAYAQERTAS